MRNDSGSHWRSRLRATPAGSETAHEQVGTTLALALRAPERADPGLAERVMAAVRADVVRAPDGARPPVWRRTVVVQMTPLRTLAVAAGLAAILFVGAERFASWSRSDSLAIAADGRADTVHVVRFIFVASGASRVAVVGDFNGWDASAHPLRPAGGSGTWTVAVPLNSGRHEYAFVIDGARWVADPAAPRALADEFGGESSILSVGSVGDARPEAGPRSG